jgi:hypothetical protein
VPPAPKKLVDPQSNISLAAKTCDACVAPDGLMYVTDRNAGLNVLQYGGRAFGEMRNSKGCR